MITPEQRKATLAIDRKLRTAMRLLSQAQGVLEEAREHVITAGYNDEMKQGVTDCIQATVRASNLTAKA